MKVLGLYDWHNCGASLVEDGKIVAAIEEERLSRNKIEFGFPALSINEVLRITNTRWNELNAIAICGERDPFFWARRNQKRYKFELKMGLRWSLQYKLWRLIYNLRNIPPIPKIEKILNKSIVSGQIIKFQSFPKDKIFLVDHHLCHASAGYRTSGFNEALILAIDGSGDGYSTTVFVGRDSELQFIGGSSERASLGKLYSNVTLGLGFSKLKGEGKVMGLAAYGDPEPFYPRIDKVIQIEDVDNMRFIATEELIDNTYAKKISKIRDAYKREDIAAACQKKFEDVVITVIKHFVDKTGISNVVLVGGAAVNVKMNQQVRELDCVNKTFIFPNMTDGGVASGAALEKCYQLSKKQGEILQPYQLNDVYLGPKYSNREIKKVLDENELEAEYCEEIDIRIGQLVGEGNIVARFNGSMEYGPRALGNRSILALPTNPDVENILNKRLRRDEFMPFAPSILEEYAEEYLERYVYSPFMVETFKIKKNMLKNFLL